MLEMEIRIFGRRETKQFCKYLLVFQEQKQVFIFNKTT